VQGLKNITIADLKAFYTEHFTQANLVLGLGGGYPDAYLPALQQTLAGLPAGKPAAGPPAAPAPPKGRVVAILEKETASVGIHFGYPLAIRRGDPDFYALMVANSFLGEHRTMHGRLMNELRPGTNNPPPNVPRRQQYFSVWIRPVAPAHAQFALRTAIDEVDRLVARGMTPDEFTLTRDFLISYSKLWARSLRDRLGIALDSRFYAMPYFIDEVEQRLQKLTVEDVNRAIREHLQTANMHVVMVGANAAELKRTIEADRPSPMKYENPVPESVTQADARIQGLQVRPATVTIIPVGTLFEK
jgi:zinc protease